MFLSPTFRRVVLVGCCALLASCGGAEHFAPLGDSTPRPPLGSATEDEATSTADDAPLRAGEGALEVVAKSDVTSYLTRLVATVTDGRGRVVAGAEADADGSRGDGAADLRLTVPAGDDYTLTLTASSTEAEPTACRAVIGPLRIDADAVASARVLGWDCGGARGYVPNTVASECFWLAEWLFVGRTRAAVGEDIPVSAAGHDADGNVARFDWSVPPPSLGRFAEPKAATTSFRCQQPGEAQPLTVAISDAECRALVSQNVACQ